MTSRVVVCLALMCAVAIATFADPPRTQWLTGWVISVHEDGFTLKMHRLKYVVHVTPGTRTLCRGQEFAVSQIKVGDSLNVVGHVNGLDVNAVQIQMRLGKSRCSPVNLNH